MTSISIVGAGGMARGLATRFLAGGHTVQLLARDAAKAQALAEELTGEVSAAAIDAAPSGDVVVLALPYAAAVEYATERSGHLTGKVVVDITNPVDFATFDDLVTPADSSAAQELAKLAPGARVVKAFNTTFAATLTDGRVADQPLDVFLAGDDTDAKAVVTGLVTDSGMRPIDAGGLKRAHQLEALGFLHMGVQGTLGNTWSTGVKVLP